MTKGLFDEPLRDDLHQKLTIRNSCDVGAELGVPGQLGQEKDFLGKDFELRNTDLQQRDRCIENQLYLSFVASSNHDMTVFAREYLIRND